jgi:hypothetical protein
MTSAFSPRFLPEWWRAREFRLAKRQFERARRRDEIRDKLVAGTIIRLA